MEIVDRSEVYWKLDELLRSMRISRGYKGFYYLIAAVETVFETGGPTLHVTKEIYPQLARKYGTTAASVERSIRCLATVMWNRGGKETFYKLAGFEINWRPTNTELIDFLVRYIELSYKKKA